MMDKLTVLPAVFIVIFFDLGIYFTARRLFFDFLVGNTSKREAKQIISSQEKKNKITMSFVMDYIRYYDDKKIFKRYYFVYKIWLFSVVPLYAVFFTVYFLFFKIHITVEFLLLLYQVIVLGIFRLPASPQRHSKYREKRGNRK